MIVSIALLGFGASGTLLSIRPSLADRAPHDQLAFCALGAGASMLGSYLIVNWIQFDSFSMAWDARQVVILAGHYVVLSAPFFFSGLAVGSLLAKLPHRSGQVYSSNLIGSASGCMLALLVPPWMGADGAVVLYTAVACAASISATAAVSTLRRPRVVAAMLMLILTLTWSSFLVLDGEPPAFLAVRLSPYKGLSYALQSPGASLVSSSWNSFSRVDVVRSGALHAVPGLSYRYLQALPSMDALFVDGDDLSPIADPSVDAAFASYLPSALPFQLHPIGSALILGARGGLDALVALTLHEGSTTAVEANPLILRAGPVYSDPRLEVLTGSERSFLHRSADTFDIIVLSLPHGYHPVRSGAFALGEDYRYTVEGFSDAIASLKPNGLLIASRWLQEPPSEDLRLFGLAVAAIDRSGGDAASQLVAFRGYNMGSVMIRNGPYSPQELLQIRAFLTDRAYDLSYAPDVHAEETNRFSVLPSSIYYQAYLGLMAAPSREAFYDDYEYDVRPPTDDHPFFGHFFKWRQAPQVAADLGKAWQPFGGAGYFVIVGLLLVASVLACLLIALPVFARRRAVAPETASFAFNDLAFFGFLGLGYLMVEIPLLQLYILYLDQPAYAAAIVLFALLLFSGLGSLVAHRAPLRPVLALVAGLAIGAPYFVRLAMDQTMGLPLWLRMTWTAAVLAPLGLLMGIPFPARLLEIRRLGSGLAASADIRVSWIWAVNGAASVISSIAAALLALTFGFSWVLRVGAGCYALAFMAMVLRTAQSRSPGR